MKKILVLDGNPQNDDSNFTGYLKELKQNLFSAQHQVQILTLREVRITCCTGCGGCNPPGHLRILDITGGFLVILDQNERPFEKIHSRKGAACMRQFYKKNKTGAIPLSLLLIIGAGTLLGVGVLGGIMLSKGVQGFVLIISFTILIVIALANITGIIRWFKALKKELKK